MRLNEQVWDYMRAGFAGMVIETDEPFEAIAELQALRQHTGVRLLVWNLEHGLSGDAELVTEAAGAADPLQVVRLLSRLTTSDSVLLVLQNFHRFLESVEVIQALQQALQHGKAHGRHVAIVATCFKLPPELQRTMVVIEHRLPNKQQLHEIATSLVTTPEELPEGETMERILDAALGLTRQEAENAFSLSLVRHNALCCDAIWETKAQLLASSGLLELARDSQGLDQLGGLESLKEFCRRSLRRTATDSAKPNSAAVRPRGILLLGVPGTGKSAFAKALGYESMRPVLTLDIGRMMGSLVGQTETNIRQALRMADAMAPCILFIDELEKALAGSVGGGARGDSGVSTRLFGTLLTWLNDHTSDVYVVATCNNIAQLPPEFSRAERFDGVVFLDLPSRREKDAIWAMYRNVFGIPSQQALPEDDCWTGAEIRACCRLAVLLGATLKDAARQIVPVGRTAEESVSQLRKWASGRCLSASEAGIYVCKDAELPTSRRLSRTRPSDN